MNENLSSNQNLKEAEASMPAAVPRASAPTYNTADYMRASVDAEYAKAEQERARRKQMVRDAANGVAAWVILPLTFILGVLICELVIRPFAAGVGMTIVILAAYAIYSAIIIKRDRSRIRAAIFMGIPVLLLALSFAFNASFNGRTLMVLLLAALVMMLNALMSGSTRSSSIFSIDTVIDAAYINMIAPFVNIGAAFSGLFSRSRGSAGGSKAVSSIGKVFIGLVISVPVVLILGLALVNADAVFEDFMDKVLRYIDKLDISVGRVFGDILVGGLVCIIGIPLVLGLRSGYTKERGEINMPRWLDSVVGATVAYAVSAVYVLFVGVQISYFFPVSISYYFGNYDFSDRLTLPENMTWAEYARSGFFELSGIIIASFAAIAFFMIFTRRRENGELPGYLKTALSIIAVCNVVMSVSAVMRMGLYTIWCGLTAKRVGVLMIIAVIAISLIAVVIKLWAAKFPLVRVIGIAALCAAVGFGCMNVERVCAEVNVSRHLEQETSIDMCYLGNLSYAAAPAVERLMNESPDEAVRDAAAGIIAKYYIYGHGSLLQGGSALNDCDFGEMTLDHWRAYDICFTNGAFGKDSELWIEESMIEDFGIYAEWQEAKRDHERWEESEYLTFEEYKDIYGEYWEYDSYFGW